MTTALGLATRPLMPNFGVEIVDVDVTRAEPDVLAEILALFNRHGAIVIRGNTLDPAEQLAFTHLFGPPETNPRNKEFTHPTHPEIFIISNKVVNGRKIGDYEAGLNWHTDNSYSRRPALCTILHALEVPDAGSDTLLSDLCAVWNALPESRRKSLEGLQARYSFQNYMQRRGFPISDEERAAMPDVWHPVVRRHPADGRKVLWISGGIHEVSGMPDEEGLPLIKDLIQFATEDRFVYHHKWQVGDILVWDNRCTLHRGTPFDTDKYFRHIHRTWVVGEIPQ